MADLLSLVQSSSDAANAEPTTPHDPHTSLEIPLPSSPHRKTSQRRLRSLIATSPRYLRRIVPTSFSGELCLRNVTFHYPARPPPAAPALLNVTLYLPARETTYIVGTSGSGKSTVGALLCNLYSPQRGRIEADEQGYEWLNLAWLKSQIAMVSQNGAVLFEGSVHDNVAIGIVGSGEGKKLEDVSREKVIEACRMALIHDFVRDLPEGYDTWLSGAKGASLSGGQRQRLALARAYIRDPIVLILG